MSIDHVHPAVLLFPDFGMADVAYYYLTLTKSFKLNWIQIAKKRMQTITVIKHGNRVCVDSSFFLKDINQIALVDLSNAL